MEIRVIASSSNGNCYYLSDGETNILIEIGVNIDTIRETVDMTCINGVLISHEHQDHAKYTDQILKYSYVYASQGTIKKLKIKNYYFSRAIAVKHLKQFKIKTFEITPFNVQHDAEEPLGFYIHSTSTNENLIFATDTYYVENRFANINYVMVECNYSKEILERNIQLKLINKVVAQRLLKSHFELENVKKFLNANDLSKCKQIYLMHLSDGNSNEQQFKNEIMELTGVPVEVCRR